MNKRILGLALPNIVTNITVPLLGMVDTAIMGHLTAAHIAAIAIGTQIFNLIYWNFGFLRMGTSGITAQAYGANDMDEAVRTFFRAFSVALFVALALILLQWPLGKLSLLVFEGSQGVLQMALTYFFVRIWAAPATLGLYAVKGWFIGMQNAKLPMWIAIFLNIVNILCSLLFVLVFHWDIRGVALGTVIAQYSGLAVGLFFLWKNYGHLFKKFHFQFSIFSFQEMRRFFKVNSDIFLRTVCLVLVFTYITRASGKISDEILAVNTLLLQFFTLFSYIMDGFAYAGESLVGRYIGARDSHSLRLSVRLILLWGLILTGAFTAIYALFGDGIIALFTDKADIISAAQPYMFWTLIVPVCGFAAFLFDGIFIGATASRAMRNCMFAATVAFFALYLGLTKLPIFNFQFSTFNTNNILWSAFMLFLIMRGTLQALLLKKSVYNNIN